MREQKTIVYTGSVNKKLWMTARLLVIAAVIALLSVKVFRLANPPYIPPEIDLTAQTGVPEPEERMAYGEISAQGGFTFGIAGTMYQQEDGSLLVYFTNPQSSDANLMCEIQNENGETIYKSGVIRPGEYIERLEPLAELSDEAIKIELYVYAFEPDTWYSKGTINLSNMLQPY